MNTYNITVPVTGFAIIEVEAETQESAIEKAFDEIELKHLEQWECHKKIVSGNVFHGLLNEIEVEEIDA